MSNLAFTYNVNQKYWDIFSEAGNLVKSDGLDSQILMSLFNDSRADDSEQPVKELQRGWIGNPIVNRSFPNYEIGCKQWLYTEQNKTTKEIAESILETVKNDGLQWMIDDGLCDDIEVEIFEINTFLGKIVLDFIFQIDENNIIKKRIILWTNTKFR